MGKGCADSGLPLKADAVSQRRGVGCLIQWPSPNDRWCARWRWSELPGAPCASRRAQQFGGPLPLRLRAIRAREPVARGLLSGQRNPGSLDPSTTGPCGWPSLDSSEELYSQRATTFLRRPLREPFLARPGPPGKRLPRRATLLRRPPWIGLLLLEGLHLRLPSQGAASHVRTCPLFSQRVTQDSVHVTTKSPPGGPNLPLPRLKLKTIPLPCIKWSRPFCGPSAGASRLAVLVKDDWNGLERSGGRHRRAPRLPWTGTFPMVNRWAPDPGPSPQPAVACTFVPSFVAMWQPFPPRELGGRGPERL